MKDRVEPLSDGFAIIVDDERIASVVREDGGWAVRDVKPTKRNSKGSRITSVSARAAFYNYFGNNRSYKSWISPLAAQLPAEPNAIEEKVREEVSIELLMAQADAAEAIAGAAAARLKTLVSQLAN